MSVSVSMRVSRRGYGSPTRTRLCPTYRKPSSDCRQWLFVCTMRKWGSISVRFANTVLCCVLVLRPILCSSTPSLHYLVQATADSCPTMRQQLPPAVPKSLCGRPCDLFTPCLPEQTDGPRFSPCCSQYQKRKKKLESEN